MGWLKKVFESKIGPTALNEYNFRTEVTEYKGPVLVDVWGPGCQPCQRLVPTIVSLANKYKGKVKVCELNAAEAPKAAGKMGVRGTPTIVAYSNGREVARVVGWKPENYLVQLIETEFAQDLEDIESGKLVLEGSAETSEENEQEASAAPAPERPKGNKKAMKKQLKKKRQQQRKATN